MFEVIRSASEMAAFRKVEMCHSSIRKVTLTIKCEELHYVGSETSNGALLDGDEHWVLLDQPANLKQAGGLRSGNRSGKTKDKEWCIPQKGMDKKTAHTWLFFGKFCPGWSDT